MSTISMFAINAVAYPIRTQAGADAQATGALPDGAFSSQVAAIWNQPSSSSCAAGSTSSANLNGRPVASSASALRKAGKTEADGVSKREGAQAEPPVSGGHTMKPASARNSRHVVEAQAREAPAMGTGAADTAGPAGPVEDDSLTTDAPQPDGRSATGTASKPIHKPSQTKDDRPDDGTATPASQSAPPVGASMPSAHLADLTTEPSDHGLTDGNAATANSNGSTDGVMQQKASDPAQVNKTTVHHPARDEKADKGAEAAFRTSDHQVYGSDGDVSGGTQAIDLSAVNNTSTPSLLSTIESAALTPNLVGASPAASDGAAGGTAADAGPATAPASATPMDATGAPAQVGASVLTLASGTDGSSQLALSLHPKDLGDVHIQLARSADGAVRVVVAATEPATLRSLMTDQAHLHAALDAAAVPNEGRHVSFELAPASSSSDAGTATDRQPDNPGSSNERAAMDLSGRGGGDGRSGDGQPGRPNGQGATIIPSNGLDRSSSFPSTRTLLLRHGSINITA